MRWIPLEANPQVMNNFIKKLGVKDEWTFTDVYGLDEELLALVPRPVAAVLLLYPLTENVVKNPLGDVHEDPDLIFIKQTIGNACGTMAILHSLANNRDRVALENAYIQKIIKQLRNVEPNNRSGLLEQDDTLNSIHEESAREGQTQAPDASTNTMLHFITFIEHNGTLYEMDGRREGPIKHCSSSKETLLEDAVKVIKKFIDRDPTQIEFSVIALAKTG